MRNKTIKYLALMFSALTILTACGGDGKNGAASDYNLLDEAPTVNITSIQVTPADITVPKSTTGEYTALAYYSDGTSADISTKAEWTSTNTNVVAFTSNIHNHAEALSVGTSTIFADYEGVHSNIAKIEVTAATLDSIQLTPLIKSVPKGVYVQYQVIGHYSDSTFYDLTPYATMSSTNTAVATIQSGGSIPALAQTLSVGTTTISAIFNGTTSNTAELNVSRILFSTQKSWLFLHRKI